MNTRCVPLSRSICEVHIVLSSLPLSDAEREEYEQAAKVAELPLAAWMRDRLSKAAKREAKKA